VKKHIFAEALNSSKTTNVNCDLNETSTTDDEQQPTKANSNKATEMEEEITTVFRLPEVNGHLIVDLRLKYCRRCSHGTIITYRLYLRGFRQALNAR